MYEAVDYRIAMHKLPIITKMLDKIAHVRKFNHIFLSSLTLMAINSKQEVQVTTRSITTTTKAAIEKIQDYINESVKLFKLIKSEQLLAGRPTS